MCRGFGPAYWWVGSWDILLKGAHWQIMGERDVLLWVYKWIPFLPVGHLILRGEMAISRSIQVKSLMCADSRSWDIDFLMAFLSTEEIIAISDTVIGDTFKRDRLVWPFDKRGRYTVKSRYHWAHLRAYYFEG